MANPCKNTLNKVPDGVKKDETLGKNAIEERMKMVDGRVTTLCSFC